MNHFSSHQEYEAAYADALMALARKEGRLSKAPRADNRKCFASEMVKVRRARILDCLQQRGPLTRRQLFHKLAIPERFLMSDLGRLRKAGKLRFTGTHWQLETPFQTVRLQ